MAHSAILRGLRAPRLAHSQAPGGHGIAADRLREVHIPGPRGKRLFGWLVLPPHAAENPAPAVLLMYGWGANAAMMWCGVVKFEAFALRLQPEIAADRLALLGYSVGAAAALLHASRHHDVRAVVSLSAFAHPREVMRRFMAEKRVPYPVLG